MTDLFTPEQLDVLRANYTAIGRIDPCNHSYRKLIAWLDACSLPVLKQLAGANIKFVSLLARNRVWSREGLPK